MKQNVASSCVQLQVIIQVVYMRSTQLARLRTLSILAFGTLAMYATL